MSRPAIIVENLGKAYRLGLQERFDWRTRHSFGEAVSNALKAPFRRLRSLGEAAPEPEMYWALRDVSFTIQPGEVTGIVGRNGAGKSTILKILSRITEPTEGWARIHGRVGSLLEVGTGFHPELTGRENIYLNGSILGMRKVEIDRKFDEIVAFAEVEKFLDTPVKRYSSGMYVRLAFAVAAHLEPEVIIVDEVLAVGDAAFQKRCLGKMSEVTRHGRTVLFVSHNMTAVRSLCTKCVVLERGLLAFDGDVDDGLAYYMSQAFPSSAQTSVGFTPPDSRSPWMRSARLITDGPDPSNMLMGDSLSVTVDFSSPFPVRHPKLVLAIGDDDGNILLNASNRYQPGHDLEASTNEGTVTCDLGVVPLMPGRYSVSLRFGDPIHETHVADNALTFEVHEHDVWGLGQVPPRSSSMLWWPTEFTVTGPEEVAGDHGSEARAK